MTIKVSRHVAARYRCDSVFHRDAAQSDELPLLTILNAYSVPPITRLRLAYQTGLLPEEMASDLHAAIAARHPRIGAERCTLSELGLAVAVESTAEAEAQLDALRAALLPLDPPSPVDMTVRYYRLDPLPPPPSGSDWPEERDHVRVELRVQLRADEDGLLAPELQRPELRWFGSLLCGHWGDRVGDRPARERRRVFTAPTYRAAENEAREFAEALRHELEASVIHPRRERLQLRAERLAYAASRPGEFISADSPHAPE